ncbi:hypothetical protein GGS20DRAFT_472847 [Poronia punctata]|nr:hypothetical protein GGS20DRAFT_472847 [Poronia punctata]
MSSSSQTGSPSIRESPPSSVSDYKTEPIYTSDALAFCQAIIFFHSCGCRTPESFFCCRPTGIQSENNLCRHATPNIVVAILPHSCSLRIGNTEACSAEDPGAHEFVREVDTAEALDLVVIGPESVSDFITLLPERIDVAINAENVSSQYIQRRRAMRRPRISARAEPFVPCSSGSAPTVAVHPVVDVARLKANDAGEGIFNSNETDIAVNGTKNEEALDGPSEEVQEKESQDEEGAAVKLSTSPEIASEDNQYERGCATKQHEDAYTELLTFWALEKDERTEQGPRPAPTPETAKGWAITSLVSRFGRIIYGN